VNGAEHYQEAERLIAAADNALNNPGSRSLDEATVDARLFYTEAQIHATLAVAAATMAAENPRFWDETR
jgi:hypothetical protein